MASICHNRDIVYSIFSGSPQQINGPPITSSSVFFLMLSFSTSINPLSALPAWQIYPQNPCTYTVIITAQNKPSQSGLPLKHLMCCSSHALSLDPIHQHRSEGEAIFFCHFLDTMLSSTHPNQRGQVHLVLCLSTSLLL